MDKTLCGTMVEIKDVFLRVVSAFRKGPTSSSLVRIYFMSEDGEEGWT